MARWGRSFPARPHITNLKVVSHSRILLFSEDLTISDDFQSLAITQTVVLEDIIVASELYVNLYGKNFDDTSTLSEGYNHSLSRILIDVSNPIDAISKADTTTLADQYTISEAFFGSRARISSDQITLSDTIANVTGYHANLTDTSTMSEIISMFRGLHWNDVITLVQEDLVKYYNGLSTTWMKIEKATSNLWTKWRKP